jgi:tryptophan halogenase
MEHRSVNNIVIVGGGTAGWLAALTANKKFPNSKVTLVESEELGILGAGEGSTPPLLSLLAELEIPLHQLVETTKTTLKNGIRFVNWKNDNTHFYHNFALNSSHLDNNNQLYKNSGEKYNYYYALQSFKKVSSKQLTTVCLLNEKNKSSFILDKTNPLFPMLNPISHSSIHFDASQLAKLLKEIALQRGVNRVEGKVTSIETNQDGDITNLNLEYGLTISSDFVFDCSGFFRLIIGKHYNSTWKSHSNKLPVKAALPFFIPVTSLDDVPPYTDSIAMKYGWMWKIPLQHRFGCGYVYDSDLISGKDARKEIEDYLGFEPEYPRKDKNGFKFNAGYFETPWVNNCVALGLSSGFIEPLEATSIGVTVLGLEYIFSDLLNLQLKNTDIAKRYNFFMKEINDEISDFLYLHYMSGRKDTEFWKHFTLENAPVNIKNMLTQWSYSFPKDYPSIYLNKFFASYSWLEVALGIGVVPQEVINSFVVENEVQKLQDIHSQMRAMQEETVDKAIGHGEFLQMLGAKNGR